MAVVRIRISHRVAALGAIGVAGLALVSAIFVVGSAKQNAHRQVASEARSAAQLSDKVSVKLLESRRAEKDFLLRNDQSYANRHATLATSIVSDLDGLKRQVAGQDDLTGKIDTVIRGFGTYVRHFRAMVQAKVQLGLDENSGLEGTLRKSVHEIEAALKNFDEPRLAVIMLMMRRHEKDFMLRRAARYGDDIKKRAGEFSALLATSNVSASAKGDIELKLAAYQRDFFSWMNAANQLAAEQKATSEAYGKIEPVIASIQQQIDETLSAAESADATSREATVLRMQLAIAATILFVAIAAWLIGRGISRPLAKMTAAMRELASGRFDIALPGLERSDEVGDMGRAVETFKRKAMEKAESEAQEKAREAEALAASRRADMHNLANAFETEVGSIVNTVSSASSQLEAAAATLSRTAEATQQLSGDVAAASNQASANVQSVAAATDQVTSSTGEISRQVQESARIAGEAVEQANATDVRISDLSNAARRIGDVVKLITAIADQTNLLALNATIEAARAGEAGRGFAVVASEVKQLASQTAKATDEISSQIAGMQDATQESVAAIKKIGNTINRISEITTTVAAAVDEQGSATHEISRNVGEAAKGTLQVATSIAEVTRGAGDTGTASARVFSSAKSLSRESTHLRDQVAKFLVTVRAA